MARKTSKELTEICNKFGVDTLPDDEADEKWIPIQHWIIDELSNFIKTCRDNNEPLDLYTGMASGTNLRLRHKNPLCQKLQMN